MNNTNDNSKTRKNENKKLADNKEQQLKNLALWQQCQQLRYHLKMLDQEKIDKLEKIGFNWETGLPKTLITFLKETQEKPSLMDSDEAKEILRFIQENEYIGEFE
jgi:hypothetical protein